MKEKMIFVLFRKMFENPPDELAQNVSKKSLWDELFLIFLRKFRI